MRIFRTGDLYRKIKEKNRKKAIKKAKKNVIIPITRSGIPDDAGLIMSTIIPFSGFISRFNIIPPFGTQNLDMLEYTIRISKGNITQSIKFNNEDLNKAFGNKYAIDENSVISAYVKGFNADINKSFHVAFVVITKKQKGISLERISI